MEKTRDLSIAPDESIDHFLARLSHEDKHALIRLVMERKRLSTSWTEMIERYQKTAEAAPLFSLSNDVALDVNRIQRLQALEQKYGNINPYFSS